MSSLYNRDKERKKERDFEPLPKKLKPKRNKKIKVHNLPLKDIEMDYYDYNVFE